MKDALHAVLNDIGYPVALMALDGRVFQQNAVTHRFVSSGLTPSSTMPYCPLLHESDGEPVIRGFTESVAASGQRQERELWRFDRWWHVHLAPVRDDHGEVVRLLLLAEDISALKAEQGARLAREKALSNTLVREVHHRIKNHLQGLVGLLRSHQESWRTVRDVIDKAVIQLQSVAAVHGLQAKNGAAVEFSLVVSKIVEALRLGSRVPVSCTFDRPPRWRVPEEDAVPLAIVVGELLMNAVKHTLACASARVEARLSCAYDGIELSIVNSPARLPEGFNLQKTGRDRTGLDLVRALLPPERAKLVLTQDSQQVTTRLVMRMDARGCGSSE